MAAAEAVGAGTPGCLPGTAATHQSRSSVAGSAAEPQLSSISPPGTAPPAAAEPQLSSISSPPGGSSSSSSSWFRYLILDCDGVLVDTERASCESLHQALLEVTGCNIPHAFPDDYTDVFGMDVRSCVAYYRDKLGRWGGGAGR